MIAGAPVQRDLSLGRGGRLRALLGRTLPGAKVVGAVDQPDVGERLREVAELAAPHRVVLLGQQAHVVAQREQVARTARRPRPSAQQREVVDQPERAGEERALARRQAVDRLLRAVALDQAVVGQLARIASTVPTMRGSRGGRKPTSGIISSAASSALLP